MLLRKCDEATQSIEVPSPETIDSEVRTYFNQQDKDWSPMLSDNDETNELVSKDIPWFVLTLNSCPSTSIKALQTH